MHASWKTWKSANAIQKSISLIRVFLPTVNVENNPRRITRNSSARDILRKRLRREMPSDAVWCLSSCSRNCLRAVNETFDPVFALLIQKDTRSCVSHRDKPPLRHLNRCRILSLCENIEYASRIRFNSSKRLSFLRILWIYKYFFFFLKFAEDFLYFIS